MKMRSLIIAIALLTCGSAMATDSHPVKGHTDKNGTYVPPHRATNPNETERDNYGSKGVTNPWNGKEGTKEPKK